jgi:hypothetical protein
MKLSIRRPWLITILLCLSQIGTFSNARAQDQDSLIVELIGQISDSSYTSSIQRLEAFSTRFETSDSIRFAGKWLYDQFLLMGYEEVEFDSFTWTPFMVDTPIVSRNIIVTKVGNVSPESLVIVGGHYDSISYLSLYEGPNEPAPGANDNATGIAGVLEIARLLQPHGFEKTLVFACFAGEEVGMGGSSHYSILLKEQDVPVRFSLVMDMIGYREDPSKWYVNIDTGGPYLDDAYRTAQLGMRYSNYLTPFLSFGAYGSDHLTLGNRGPAVAIYESAGYADPVFHTPFDVLDSLDVSYATEILNMALASVVDAARPSTVGIGDSEGTESGPMLPIPVLHQNFPNPFNPTTMISFDLPGDSGATHYVSLTIYDIRGKLVRTLLGRQLDPGSYRILWDGRDENTHRVSSGIYFSVLRIGEKAFTRKMIACK